MVPVLTNMRNHKQVVYEHVNAVQAYVGSLAKKHYAQICAARVLSTDALMTSYLCPMILDHMWSARCLAI